MNKREAEIKSQKLIAELAEIRKLQKVSRSKIAKNLGMSTTTITKIETFEQTPKLSTLYLIADFLNCDIQLSLKK